MKSFKVSAPAKINIGLNVVEKRDDGFHNLETIFYPVKSLCDELEFTITDLSGIKFYSDFTLQPENNLILKAVEKLFPAGLKNGGLKIRLTKRIPVGAGLGGGSSDAAFTLKALNEYFKLNIEGNELRKLALELGSDVPFFLVNIPAIAYSRGEILEPVELNLPGKLLVIVNPGIHISTKEAFKNIIPREPEICLKEILYKPGDQLENLRNYARNDFEGYVFEKYPEIRIIKEHLLSRGALFAMMSGTGSSVFAIFNSDTDLSGLEDIFPNKYFLFSTKL